VNRIHVRALNMIGLLGISIITLRQETVRAVCQTPGYCSDGEWECEDECRDLGGVYEYECGEYQPNYCQWLCTCNS
jgi:hypothetical protein